MKPCALLMRFTRKANTFLLMAGVGTLSKMSMKMPLL